jgi:hypothetical protein
VGFRLLSQVSPSFSALSCNNAIIPKHNLELPIPGAARSKTWICSRLFAGIVGSNSTGIMDVCFLWVKCVVRSLRDALITRPEETDWPWCFAVCDLETKKWRGHCPCWAAASQEKKSWSLLSDMTVHASECRAIGSIAILKNMRKQYNISDTSLVFNF